MPKSAFGITFNEAKPTEATRYTEVNRAEAGHQRELSQDKAAESSSTFSAPGALAVNLPARDADEKQLHEARREIELLSTNNDRLVRALAGALHQISRDHGDVHNHELSRLSTHRFSLTGQLQQAHAAAARGKSYLALLFITLDGFTKENDLPGQAIGDKLLTIVANRIAGCACAKEAACRYGDDEFVVLIPNIEEAASAVEIANEIRNQIGGFYWIDGDAFRITATVGVAMILPESAEAPLRCGAITPLPALDCLSKAMI